MERVVSGRPVVSGDASGELLVSREALSLWGGYDAETGEIIDRRHPLSGRMAAGLILAIPSTRGSSTTTAVLLEALRAGTAPAAFLTSERDAFLALASVVAEQMYGASLPIVELAPAEFARLESGSACRVDGEGRVFLSSRSG